MPFSSSRRNLSIGAIALLAGALSLLSPRAGARASASQPQRLIQNLTGAIDRTRSLPAGAPAPAQSTGIGPGAHLLIDRPDGLFGCTANFVWKDSASSKLYLGAAGHCFLPAGTVATAGPGADYNPSLSHVRVCVSSCDFGGQAGFIIEGTTVALGPVAYSRQTEGGVDLGNDFGVVEIPTADAGQVRNTVPVWGGPTGTTVVGAGTPLCLYGNGVGVGEVFPTMARMGVSKASTATYWEGEIPSSPGDSGSAVITCQASATSVMAGDKAVGILTHLVLGTQGLVVGTRVDRAIAMASEAGLSLVLQTA